MRILITGGTGYLGRYLSARLLKKDQNEVHVLARQRAAVPHRVRLHIGDIASYTQVENVVLRVEPHVVFHLAGDTRRGKDVDVHGEIFNTNVVGTANLLQALYKRKPQALVAVGSFEEYGPITTPFTERSVSPVSAYGMTKAAATTIVSSIGRSMFGATVLRFPVLYGATVRQDSFLGVLARALANKEKMPLASGLETRDFLHVEDALDALEAAAHLINRCTGEVMNICSGVEVSLLEVIALAEEIVGVSGLAGLNMIPERPNEQRSYFGSYEKAKRILGFEPKVSLRAGLSELLNPLRRRS